MLTLSYTDLSTQKAEDVLNTLLDIYSRERIEDKKQSAINTSKFINGRLLIIEQELGGIDNNIEQYKSSQLLTNVQLEGANCLQNQMNIRERHSTSATSWPLPNISSRCWMRQKTSPLCCRPTRV